MPKEKVDLLIINANELATLKETKIWESPDLCNLGTIKHGAIAVNEDKIVEVDKTSTIEQRYKSDTTIDASKKLVTPGFIDAHSHVVFAGTREEEFELRLQGSSYLEILAKGGGILKTVTETRKASKEQLVENARKTVNNMLQHGTTTLEAKSGYGLTTEDEIKCLEAAKTLNDDSQIDIVSTFLGAHAVPPEYKSKPDEYVSLIIEEMIPKITKMKLAEFCDVFCEHGVFNIKQSKSILETGKEFGLKPKVHADELTRMGGAELAASVNASSADHLLFSSKTGIKLMLKEKVMPVLLPQASFSLMTGEYADARGIIQMGSPVALGTDFNPSCLSENMQMTIALACREMQLTPSESLFASTIGSAYSIDRSNEIGSLESGKKADIVIFNIPNHKFLGYRFGVNLVDKVVKNGKIIVKRS